MNRRNLLLVLSVAVTAVLLLGADSPKFISSDEAHALVKSGALLLDVRTPQEFAEGHIDGATNIPVQELEARLADVKAAKDQAVVVYCRSGKRSESAKGILEKAGWKKVSNLGPMTAWKQ